MKSIKIKFVDFWPDFTETDNFIYNILSTKYNVQISEEPDFLFYSAFGHAHLQYSCIRIFFTGENQTPDFNICDYAIGFHHITFEDRYLRLPLYFLYDDDLRLASQKHIITQEDLNIKDKFCNFIYSNANAHPYREEFFHALHEQKHVHSGGKHLNNIGRRVENKLEFQKTTKFTIAFENTSASGYTTEKIIQAFSAKTIPIYWGNPNIASEFNQNSFINCHSFNSTGEIISRILEIENNDDLYKKMLKTPIQNKDLYSYLQSITTSFLFNVIDKGNNVFMRDIHSWGKNYEIFLKKAINTLETNPNKTLLQKIKNRL